MKSLDHWSIIFRYFLLPCMWSLHNKASFCLHFHFATVHADQNWLESEGNHIQGRRKCLYMLLQRTRDCMSTVCGHRMAHRKWKETKKHPSMLPGPAVPGCYFISFHFLWAILWPHPVLVGRYRYRSKRRKDDRDSRIAIDGEGERALHKSGKRTKFECTSASPETRNEGNEKGEQATTDSMHGNKNSN